MYTIEVRNKFGSWVTMLDTYDFLHVACYEAMKIELTGKVTRVVNVHTQIGYRPPRHASSQVLCMPDQSGGCDGSSQQTC